jgi:hypothetical protein
MTLRRVRKQDRATLSDQKVKKMRIVASTTIWCARNRPHGSSYPIAYDNTPNEPSSRLLYRPLIDRIKAASQQIFFKNVRRAVSGDECRIPNASATRDKILRASFWIVCAVRVRIVTDFEKRVYGIESFDVFAFSFFDVFRRLRDIHTLPNTIHSIH